MYGVLAVGIAVLYKEIKDLSKEVRKQLRKINDNLSGFGERIAKLEAIVEKRK